MECGVCFHMYSDEGDKRPRALSCGHSFCTSCICAIITKEGLTCPTCRISHEVLQSEQVAVNYGLLEILKLVGNTEEEEERTSLRSRSPSVPSVVECPTPVPDDSCAEHGELWCNRCLTCDVWMCSNCPLEDHVERGCEVISSQDALKDLVKVQKEVGLSSMKFYDIKIAKLNYSESILELHLQKQEAILNGLNELIKRQNNVIRLVKEERERVQEASVEGKIMRNTFQVALNKVEEIESQRELSLLLKEIRTIDVKLGDWARPSQEDFEESDIKNISLKQLVTSTSALRLMATADLSWVDMVRENGGIYAVRESTEGEIQSAKVSLSGGHVLLHALENKCPPSSLTMQYSAVKILTSHKTPVCFLALSKNEHYIGRIYIRILSASKRSHQFRLLCTGEKGPCYKNTSFFGVQKIGEPGECLLGGDYDHGDGSGGSPLLEDLKPGPEYREVVTQGLVAGSNGEHSALFGIFLRDWGGVSDTAFGRVIKNLKLIQAAVEATKDVKQLKISDCGVVIPL